jgi:hypothetical protein
MNKKIKYQNELGLNDTFKIVNVLKNIIYNFVFVVVETEDKRLINVPLFYFKHNKI